jgi:hypothetical protein
VNQIILPHVSRFAVAVSCLGFAVGTRDVDGPQSTEVERPLNSPSLFGSDTKNVANDRAHQSKNDWRSFVENFLTRAFSIDEVQDRSKYEQRQKPDQCGVRNSEFAGFQIRVGRRSPNDEPGENDHRDKRNESEIDQQILFDHVSLLGT